MANTALNVSTGKPRVTGGIYRAPIGTALPTDAKTALAQDYVSLGYIATDGVTQSSEIDSGEYRAWGGDVVLAYVNATGVTVSACDLNAEYDYTDTQTKRYRYQAVFDLVYY